MAFKTVFYLGIWAAAYILLVTVDFNTPVTLLLWLIIGFFSAFIGLNICHDAVHGSLSSNKHVNKVLGMVFNLVGANAYTWHIMHNIVHHTYTNIEGHDEDIQSTPLLRMSPHQKLRPVHKKQHWYAFAMYGFASLSWVFVKDYVKFFKKKIGNYENKKHPPVEYFNLFFFKGLYYFLFLVVPLIVLNFTWWQVLLGFLLMHYVEGYTLAIIFMLAHVVEETHFPLPDDKGQMDNSWAAHQMYTTANFGTSNTLLSFFCGGLNFQVEHHLFPRVSHVHYKKISRIVKATAGEFNLPYYDNPTFTGAIGSHYKLLKKLGREPMAA
jgi:linoleoyl-CoA desaturase